MNKKGQLLSSEKKCFTYRETYACTLLELYIHGHNYVHNVIIYLALCFI